MVEPRLVEWEDKGESGWSASKSIYQRRLNHLSNILSGVKLENLLFSVQ